MLSYQDRIKSTLAMSGYRGMDPRHIEAAMRLTYSTLDHLSREAFDREVVDCASELIFMSEEWREELARSFGL